VLVWLEVLTALNMKMAVVWVVAPCRMVWVCQHFRGLCCLHWRYKDLWNVGKLMPVCKALQSRRQPSSLSGCSFSECGLCACSWKRVFFCNWTAVAPLSWITSVLFLQLDGCGFSQSPHQLAPRSCVLLSATHNYEKTLNWCIITELRVTCRFI
jgi:hypothetical protein